MSQRHNITLPNELSERLEKVKTNDFNVSKICQEAIELKVKVEEARQSTLEDREAMILRLRLERESAQADAFIRGQEDGSTFAKSATYKEFKALETLRENRTNLIAANRWVTLDLLPESIRKDIIDHYQRHPNKKLPSELQQFLAGFVEAMLEIWDEVSKEL